MTGEMILGYLFDSHRKAAGIPILKGVLIDEVSTTKQIQSLWIDFLATVVGHRVKRAGSSRVAEEYIEKIVTHGCWGLAARESLLVRKPRERGKVVML